MQAAIKRVRQVKRMAADDLAPLAPQQFAEGVVASDDSVILIRQTMGDQFGLRCLHFPVLMAHATQAEGLTLRRSINENQYQHIIGRG